MSNISKTLFIALILLLLCAPGYAGAKSAGTSGRTSPVVVRRELRNILSAREYQVPVKSQTPVWIKKILDPIGKAIERFFGLFGGRPNFGGKTTGRIASYIFASIVLLAFLWLLGIVIFRLMNSLGSDEAEEESLSPEFYQLPSARPLISEAEKLAQQADYRGAFRYAYLACISYLDEKNALRFERSRTNWEYLCELKQGGHDLPYTELQPLTVAFDRKFYGREDCTYEDYAGALSVFNRIASEARA